VAKCTKAASSATEQRAEQAHSATSVLEFPARHGSHSLDEPAIEFQRRRLLFVSPHCNPRAGNSTRLRLLSAGCSAAAQFASSAPLSTSPLRFRRIVIGHQRGNSISATLKHQRHQIVVGQDDAKEGVAATTILRDAIIKPRLQGHSTQDFFCSCLYHDKSAAKRKCLAAQQHAQI